MIAQVAESNRKDVRNAVEVASKALPGLVYLIYCILVWYLLTSTFLQGCIENPVKHSEYASVLFVVAQSDVVVTDYNVNNTIN